MVVGAVDGLLGTGEKRTLKACPQERRPEQLEAEHVARDQQAPLELRLLVHRAEGVGHHGHQQPHEQDDADHAEGQVDDLEEEEEAESLETVAGRNGRNGRNGCNGCNG